MAERGARADWPARPSLMRCAALGRNRHPAFLRCCFKRRFLSPLPLFRHHPTSNLCLHNPNLANLCSTSIFLTSTPSIRLQHTKLCHLYLNTELSHLSRLSISLFFFFFLFICSNAHLRPPLHISLYYPLSTHPTPAKMFSRGLRVVSRRAAMAAPLARPTLAPRQLAPVASIEAKRSYHEKVLDHYARPRNVGSMNKSDSDVGTGLVGAPACGDVMKLQIRVDPETQKISEVKFKTFGCGSAIASSSYLTELVRGMSLDDAGKVKNTEIAKELCLPPVKRTY